MAQFTHDCDDCVFLDEHDGRDLYYCPREPTVLARRSSTPSDYISGIEFGRRGHPILSVALVRAYEQGHIKPKA